MDHFQEVRDKRMSELSAAQRDLAHELWLRENIGWVAHNQESVKAVFRVIDRLREDLARQTSMHEQYSGLARALMQQRTREQQS